MDSFKTDKRYKPANEPPKAPGQYFSDKVIDNSVMKIVDVDLRFLVNRYVGEKSGKAIQAWDATIKMKNGDLKIDPVKFAVASGHIGGRFLIDGRKLPLDVQIELGAKRINLDTLLGPLAKEVPVLNMKPTDMARGMLTGQLDLAMKGKTPMEMAKSVRGPIELAIEDGKLSGTVIEAFGLDITQTISNWFQKHPLYDIQCALTAFEAKDGAIKTKSFLIATKDTSILGKGEVNLVANKVDFKIHGHVHDFSIGSLRTPFTIRGPLNDFKVNVEREEILTRTSLAVALGTLVSPIAALIPLIEPGLDEKGKCRSVVAELNVVQEKAAKLSTGKSGRVTR
jgi:AsmA family protein